MHKLFAITWILASLQLHNVTSAVIDPTVTIAQGKLKGGIGEARNGRDYVEYLGIPYVKKPERFQEATGTQNWEGLRDGTKFGPPCPQFDRKSKSVIGSEDCLFLNLFTPTPVSKQGSAVGTKAASSTTAASPIKRPVIVYIHGGSFVSQSSDLFGPKYLLDENLILVTFNYRLSVLGFLSTGDKEMVANLALRDQIQALKWVNQNIQAFGGDPAKVTIFGGGSAGGAMASYLTLSPLSKGLFSNVISTSGNALCPWAVVRNPGKIAAKLAMKLNCPNTKTSKDIVACIKGKSIKDIEIARVSLQGFSEDPAVPFAPVVESWLSKDFTNTAVVPEAPEKLMAEGKFARVPWLTGVNSLNGVNLAVANIVTTPKRLTQVDQDWEKLAPTMFHFSQTAPYPGNVSEDIREHYFGKKKISAETKDKFITALTDRNFIYCTAKAASIQAKFIPVFLYNLNYIGAASFLDDWGVRDKLDLKGVVHGDELQHLFNLKLDTFPVLKKGDKHFPFSEKMVKLWASFARNGKPMESTETAGAEWSPVLPNQSKSIVQWYNLDSVSLSRPIVFDEYRQSTLWDHLDLGESLKSQDVPKFAIGYEMPLLNLKTSSSKPPIGAKPTAIPGSKPSSQDPLTPLKIPLTPLSKYSSSLDIPSYSPKPSDMLTPLKTQVTPAPASKSSSLDIPKYSPKPSDSLTPLKTQVTPSPPSKLSSSSLDTSNSSPKPDQTSGKTVSVAPKVTPKPLVTPKVVDSSPPSVISAIFKDEDPYSSTTTTTTKKPGFFSKILG